MTINALLSTIILVSFIVTIVLAVGSYMAYKVREHRRPVVLATEDDGPPVFFERFFPRRSTEAAEADVRPR